MTDIYLADLLQFGTGQGGKLSQFQVCATGFGKNLVEPKP